MPRILIVEDESALLDTLKRFFTREKYDVYAARCRSDALELAHRFPPDVAVLDVMLNEGPEPEYDGFEVCKALRDADYEGPIIFLTARTSEQDKLLGFDLGADDYVTKPFSLLELAARVSAVLRRMGGARSVYRFGTVEVDLDNYVVRHPDAEERLSNREQELLRYLIEHRGKVLPREELLTGIWRYSPNVTTRTVDTHILNVRKKLRDDASSPRFIETMHGVGYRFIAEEGVILPALLLGALLAAPARGEPLEDWQATDVDDWDDFHDAMLYAAEGDHAGAVRRFERLVRELPGGDLLRPQVLYRLGEARLVLRDVDGAREALREGVRTGCPRSRCLALLGSIEFAESSVRKVPTVWTFSDGVHGFMHPWRFADMGSIRVERGGPEASLLWATRVMARSEDEITVGFDEPTPAPRGIRFEVASLVLDAHLRLVLVDVRGRTFAASDLPLFLPVGKVVRVDIRLRDLVAEDGVSRLVPSELERLVIKEVTANYGTILGENQVLLDDFAVY